MHVKPLNIQYRLIGKNIPPTEVSSARSVEAALRENGLLCDRFSGMGVFEEEWVKRREFALEGEFDIGKTGVLAGKLFKALPAANTARWRQMGISRAGL